jgi:hypothetical protein
VIPVVFAPGDGEETAMGWNDHADADAEDRAAVLRQLLAEGSLAGAVQQGVARQVIAQGVRSLSPRQEVVFRAIEREHLIRTCERCGEEIPLGELLFALDSGLCGYCEHLLDD